LQAELAGAFALIPPPLTLASNDASAVLSTWLNIFVLVPPPARRSVEGGYHRLMVTVLLTQPGHAVDGPHSEQNLPALGSSTWSRHVGSPGEAPLKLHEQRSLHTGPLIPPGVHPIPCTPPPLEV